MNNDEAPISPRHAQGRRTARREFKLIYIIGQPADRPPALRHPGSNCITRDDEREPILDARSLVNQLNKKPAVKRTLRTLISCDTGQLIVFQAAVSPLPAEGCYCYRRCDHYGSMYALYLGSSRESRLFLMLPLRRTPTELFKIFITIFLLFALLASKRLVRASMA